MKRFMTITVCLLIAVGSANAAVLEFTGFTGGPSGMTFDADGDTIHDVQFTSGDGSPFNPTGPGLNQVYIVEPGLEGTSQAVPYDLRADFLFGAEDSLGFGFAVDGASGQVVFTVYDAGGTQLATTTVVAGGSPPSGFPENGVSLPFAGVAAYATFDFQGPHPRYIIDNLAGPYGSYRCYPDLPDPELTLTGWEEYVGSDGQDYIRYRLSVVNWPEFPDELFEAAPDLPPCGLNPNASRTWVDIYDQDGTRIYGFCALDEAEDLFDHLWFGILKGTTPPECVYITLTDRRCDNEYISNLACMLWDIPVDIKPGSCPNPLNPNSKGSVPVAIVGTADLDVLTIDPTTLELAGVPIMPDNVLIADVTQPGDYDPAECYDCFDEDDYLTDIDGDGIGDIYLGDGIDDLVVKFDTRALAAAIAAAERNECVELNLTGYTFDGVPIWSSSDSMRILKKINGSP